VFIDSHCHLDFPELASRLDELLAAMQHNRVTHALCVAVNLEDWPRLIALVARFEMLFASVGVHPDHVMAVQPTEEQLLRLAAHPKVIAIGETGLDYYRLAGDLSWQQERFRRHIRVARQLGLPLIIHSRHAAADTLRIMQEEGAEQVGGVMHCFTETAAVAEAAMAMNFYISFSGIVTFKNARELQKLASQIPIERLLIETDAPYLAPVPHRGSTNHPALVKHVAECIAQLRDITVEQVAAATSANFQRLFRCDLRSAKDDKGAC